MKKLKIRTLVTGGLILSTIPLMLLIFILFGYTIRKNRLYSHSLTEKSQESVLASLSLSVSAIQKETDEVIRSSDYLYYSNSSSDNRITHYAGRLIQAFQDSLSPYPEFAGVILYHQKTGCFLKHFSQLKYTEIQDSVTDSLTDFKSSRSVLQKVISVSGEPMLLYRVSQRYGCVGILMDPAENTVYRSLLSAMTEDSGYVFSADETVSETRREVNSMALSDYPLYLHVSLPAKGFFRNLDSLQIGILITLMLVIMVASVFFLFMQLQLLTPLEHFSNAFGQVEEGDLNYRLKSVSRISEINGMYHNFNSMLDGIHEAEEESQRQRMDAMQAKLQYLQLQIRPHFYLNCLKNINSLAELHQDDKIQELVIYLSDYFRYNFQDVRNFVTVREELEAVQSYVNLCRCLYYSLNLRLDIESAVLRVLCLPMTILTFVENCIKHGGDIRELEIRISAYIRINDDEEPEAVIEIRNNGAFSEEALQDLESSPVQTVSYGREHVGIKNVRYRLFLLYKDRASVSFFNEPGWAVVRTVFPVENEHHSGDLL